MTKYLFLMKIDIHVHIFNTNFSVLCRGGGISKTDLDYNKQEGEASSSRDVILIVNQRDSRRQQRPWARAELTPVSSFYDFISALKNVIPKIHIMTHKVSTGIIQH